VEYKINKKHCTKFPHNVSMETQTIVRNRKTQTRQAFEQTGSMFPKKNGKPIVTVVLHLVKCVD